MWIGFYCGSHSWRNIAIANNRGQCVLTPSYDS
jgi:hypothetical protein